VVRQGETEAPELPFPSCVHGKTAEVREFRALVDGTPEGATRLSTGAHAYRFIFQIMTSRTPRSVPALTNEVDTIGIVHGDDPHH